MTQRSRQAFPFTLWLQFLHPPRLKFQGSIRTQSTEGVPKVFLVILEVPSCAFLGTQLLTPGGDSLQGSSWTILFLLHFSSFSATP